MPVSFQTGSVAIPEQRGCPLAGLPMPRLHTEWVLSWRLHLGTCMAKRPAPWEWLGEHEKCSRTWQRGLRFWLAALCIRSSVDGARVVTDTERW